MDAKPCRQVRSLGSRSMHQGLADKAERAIVVNFKWYDRKGCLDYLFI